MNISKRFCLTIFLCAITISCKIQTTYSNDKLKKQKLEIIQSQCSEILKEKNGKLTIGDIISQLKVKPLSIFFDHTNPDTNMVNVIILDFYNTKDLNYLINNNLQAYNISFVLKNEIKRTEVAQVFMDNKKVWNKNVYNYLKDLEIIEVRSNPK